MKTGASTKIKSLRILFIITGLSPHGAEIMLLKLLQHLDRAKFTPYVISLGDGGGLGDSIRSLGISVEALEIRGVLTLFRGFFALIWKIHKINPDIVHTWMYHADLLGGVAAKLAGVKYISWGIFQSNISSALNKKSTLIVMHLCAFISKWLPTKILSCSHHAIDTHSAAGYFRKKFFVIPIGFEVSKFKPDNLSRETVRGELGVSDKAPIIGLIGRFDPQKNHLGFLEACAFIHRRRPDAIFLLAGKNIDSQNILLVKAIEALELNRVVHLLGERDDVPSLMCVLDLLVSSSSGEGFPTVLGEAMATGAPCVATNVGDSKFIIGDAGLLVEPTDMEGLASAVLELLAMSDLEFDKLRERARSHIKNNFSIARIVVMYEEFYYGLIANLDASK